MKQIVSSIQGVKAGNGQAAVALGASSCSRTWPNCHNTSQAAVTSPSRACTPIYRRAFTLSEYRCRHMSSTHNRDGARRVHWELLLILPAS
jgi:hypothetical protein